MAVKKPIVNYDGQLSQIEDDDSVEFSILSGLPTTLDGYGITDAVEKVPLPVSGDNWYRIETDMLANSGATSKIQVIIRGVHGHINGAENGAFGQWKTIYSIIQANKAPSADYTHATCMSFGGIARAIVGTYNDHVTVWVIRDSLYDSSFTADVIGIKGDTQANVISQEYTTTSPPVDATEIPVDLINLDTVTPLNKITTAMTGAAGPTTRDWSVETQPQQPYRITTGSSGYWYQGRADDPNRNYDTLFSNIDRRAYSGFWISNKDGYAPQHYFLWVDERGQVFTRNRYQTGEQWTRFWDETNLDGSAIATIIENADPSSLWSMQGSLGVNDLRESLVDIKTDSGVPTFRQPDEPQITGERRNLVTSSEGPLASLVTNGSPVGVVDAPETIEGFSSAYYFGDNSVQRSLYLGRYTADAGTTTFSVFIQMDDDGIPEFGTDFRFYVKGSPVTSGATVTHVRGSLHRVSYTTTGSGSFTGVQKTTTHSSRGFRVAGYQVEFGNTSTSYQATRSATDFDGSGLPVGSIWHRTEDDEVVQTLRYNGATWDDVDIPTDLAIAERTATDLQVTSSTGDSATLPSATTSLAGLLEAADKSKLDGIQSGATVGATWGTNLAGIPANITAWESVAPESKFNTPSGNTNQYIRGDGSLGDLGNFVNTTGDQSNIAGEKTWTGLHTFLSDLFVDGNIDTSGSISASLIADSKGDVRKLSGRVANASVTLTDNDLNSSIEKGNSGSFTYTIPEDLGEHRDAITIVNSSLTGNITVQRGGNVELWQNGVNDDITVGPGSMITIFRSTTLDRWIA